MLEETEDRLRVITPARRAFCASAFRREPASKIDEKIDQRDASHPHAV